MQDHVIPRFAKFTPKGNFTRNDNGLIVLPPASTAPPRNPAGRSGRLPANPERVFPAEQSPGYPVVFLPVRSRSCPARSKNRCPRLSSRLPYAPMLEKTSRTVDRMPEPENAPARSCSAHAQQVPTGRPGGVAAGCPHPGQPGGKKHITPAARSGRD